jgi:hypothetical protein
MTLMELCAETTEQTEAGISSVILNDDRNSSTEIPSYDLEDNEVEI